jgi:hypothetical protein
MNFFMIGKRLVWYITNILKRWQLQTEVFYFKAQRLKGKACLYPLTQLRLCAFSSNFLISLFPYFLISYHTLYIYVILPSPGSLNFNRVLCRKETLNKKLKNYFLWVGYLYFYLYHCYRELLLSKPPDALNLVSGKQKRPKSLLTLTNSMNLVLVIREFLCAIINSGFKEIKPLYPFVFSNSFVNVNGIVAVSVIFSAIILL